MTCDAAREALIEADLPVGQHASELATHPRECAACATIADVLTRDLTLLRTRVRGHASRRRRVAVIAGASTIAAAISIVVLRINSRAAIETIAPVNTAQHGVVSVQVPPGKTAIVLQTKDPNVTVVWLSNDAGGGL